MPGSPTHADPGLETTKLLFEAAELGKVCFGRVDLTLHLSMFSMGSAQSVPSNIPFGRAVDSSWTVVLLIMNARCLACLPPHGRVVFDAVIQAVTISLKEVFMKTKIN